MMCNKCSYSDVFKTLSLKFRIVFLHFPDILLTEQIVLKLHLEIGVSSPQGTKRTHQQFYFREAISVYYCCQVIADKAVRT